MFKSKMKSNVEDYSELRCRISRMEEDIDLLKNPPKYNVGELVFYMVDGNFYQGNIYMINGGPGYWSYSFKGDSLWVAQDMVYKLLPTLKK